MNIFFASNRLSSFLLSSTNLTETTVVASSPARFDNTFVESAINVPDQVVPYSKFTTPPLLGGSQTEVWLHYEIANPSTWLSVTSTFVEFFNSSGIVVARFQKLNSAAGAIRFEYWNGSSFVTTGATLTLTAASRINVDIHLKCGGSPTGEYHVYLNGALADSVTGGLNAAVDNVNAISLTGMGNSAAGVMISQIIVADEDTTLMKLVSKRASANGSNNDGTGSYTDTNSIPYNPTLARVLPANGDKFTMVKSGFTPLPSGLYIGAVLVNGMMRTDGSVVDNSRPVIRLSGTDYTLSDVSPPPTSGYQPKTGVWLTSPVTATAFSLTEFNNLEFGWEART